jgi:DNA invertase Pin-like site-specific DNA recombinase
MLKRQREGAAKTKAEGKYRGRARTAMAKADQIESMLAAGVSPTGVAHKLGIDEARSIEPSGYAASNVSP